MQSARVVSPKSMVTKPVELNINIRGSQSDVEHDGYETISSNADEIKIKIQEVNQELKIQTELSESKSFLFLKMIENDSLDKHKTSGDLKQDSIDFYKQMDSLEKEIDKIEVEEQNRGVKNNNETCVNDS